MAGNALLGLLLIKSDFAFASPPATAVDPPSGLADSGLGLSLINSVFILSLALPVGGEYSRRSSKVGIVEPLPPPPSNDISSIPPEATNFRTRGLVDVALPPPSSCFSPSFCTLAGGAGM